MAEITKLDMAWEAINALGGSSEQNNSYDQGAVDVIAKALEAIEVLGGMDPKQRASAAATAPVQDVALLELADEFDGEAKAHKAMGDHEEARKCAIAATILRAAATAPVQGADEPVAWREALAPFAKLAEYVSENHRDSRPVIHGLAVVIAERLTIGDLRRAKAALYAHPSSGRPASAAGISALDDASNACLELASKHGFATGHGDTVADMIREFSAQINSDRPASADILAKAIQKTERDHPLPKCRHGYNLRDGSGEALEPPCGCRADRPAYAQDGVRKAAEDVCCFDYSDACIELQHDIESLRAALAALPREQDGSSLVTRPHAGGQ
jgi:hypothetical protein